MVPEDGRWLMQFVGMAPLQVSSEIIEVRSDSGRHLDLHNDHDLVSFSLDRGRDLTLHFVRGSSQERWDLVFGDVEDVQVSWSWRGTQEDADLFHALDILREDPVTGLAQVKVETGLCELQFRAGRMTLRHLTAP